MFRRSNKRKLKEELEKQIMPASCVIVIAGMYVNYREWIQEEIKIAKKYGKPIIAVKPRGNQKLPTFIQENADKIVGWNANSIIDAIKKLCK
ncbi:TIR domain-containing protein [Methanotorris igneus]|uniref:TIR domain-containing protein n=1 Tax=Methanotorris igneus TaxID=2189 RepID=UPI002478D209|nr:TIR domain-containing protein [Methanotorris igneus]